MALRWRKSQDDDEPDEEEARVYQFPNDVDDVDIEEAQVVEGHLLDPEAEPHDDEPIDLRKRGSEVAILDDEGIDELNEPGAEIEPWSPSGVLAERFAAMAERSFFPPVEHMKASAQWWAATLGRDLLWFLLHPWVPIRNEARPIVQGVRVTWETWTDWRTVADMAETEASMPKEAAGRAKFSADRETHRSRRRKISWFLAIATLVGAVLAWFWWTTYLIVAAFLALALLDVVGRRHPDPDNAPPPRRRTMLEEGAPMGSLTTTILERFAEEGLRVEAAGRMYVHAASEYRLDVNHEDAIEPKHLRSLERHINALATSVRCIATGVGGVSQLRLPTRDHLAVMPTRPWADTGTRSIQDPANLWKRSDGDPSSPNLSAVHIDLVGTTGAGKSEALQEIISFLGECDNVYPVFGDLTRGPLGPLNKRVLRKTAYSIDDLDALLDWALEKVEERHLVLHRLAESDDDDDAPIEWDLSWGPEIKIILDEYSFIAINNGKNDTIDLHGKVEAIMRVGRKVKVTVIRASQRSGNADLGSTVAQALVGLKILMACTERDTTTMLSTDHRDQGWTPHLFRPAVKGDPRDAGKCFVWGPGHRDPEIHRFHQPRPPGEIKRTDRRRAEDGLPNLDGTPRGEQPAILLSPVQAAVEQIFAERGAIWLPTAVIIPALAERDLAVNASQLGDELGNCGTRADWEGRQVRGYAIADVQKAWGIE